MRQVSCVCVLRSTANYFCRALGSQQPQAANGGLSSTSSLFFARDMAPLDPFIMAG